MGRKRSESTSSSGSFPTPIPNLYASQLLNGLPDEDSEGDLSMSPIPSTMPTQMRSHPGSPAASLRIATQPEPLPRTKISKASKRKSNSDVNDDDLGNEEINNSAREPQSLRHGMMRSKKSKRHSSERITINNDDDADGPFEVHYETSLPVNLISGNELRDIPVDDKSAERKRRKERKRERRLLSRVGELGLAGDTLYGNGLASAQFDAVSPRKKDRTRTDRWEIDIASKMVEDPARHEQTGIPEDMRGFTKDLEITGTPTEEHVDGGATDGSPALARKRRRQGKSSASEKLLKAIADKAASHASLPALPRDRDSEDEETPAFHDNQVISPPPTNDQPATSSGNALLKSQNGHSRRIATTGDQGARELNANIHPSGCIESNQALATAEAPPSATPGLQRASKRKLKKPFFERGKDPGAQVPAERPTDDPAAPMNSGLGASRSTGTSEDVLPAASNVKLRNQGKSRAVPKDEIKHESNDGIDAKTKSNSQYLSGTLTLAEQEQVCSAVESVRENAGLSEAEMNQIIHENPQRQKNPLHAQLWNAVAEACPTRSRKKLMEWCRQHFHNFVSRGVWTEEQDAELMQMIRIHGHRWSVIGGLINRHQKDVRDRYRNYLICQGASKSRYWSSEEEDKFFNVIEKAVDAIRKDLGQGDWDNKSVEDLINWGQISEAMAFERTRLQCLEKWKRLRAANAIPNRITLLLPMGQSSRLAKARRDLQRMTGEEKYLLVCGIRDSNAENEPEIPWEEIMTNVFNGKFQRQALLVAWGRLRDTIADWEQQTTAECAAQIADMYEEDNGFLLDDRTVASRSREPTAELGTPSTRGSTKRRHGSMKSKSLVPKVVARSKPTVDPKDDMSEGGEDNQLPDLLMQGGGRSRSRIDFEEVDESVFGEGDDQFNGDAERANGHESDTDDRDRRHTPAAKRKRARARAASLDLGANSDDEVRPLDERLVDSTELAIVKSPRKRGSTDNTRGLMDGTQDRGTIGADTLRESPAKKRRTLHHKTYSSAAKKALKRVGNISPRKIPKRINGRRLAIGSSSASTSMQLPQSSQLRAQGPYSDLSSDMDRDMSDIPG